MAPVKELLDWGMVVVSGSYPQSQMAGRLLLLDHERLDPANGQGAKHLSRTVPPGATLQVAERRWHLGPGPVEETPPYEVFFFVVGLVLRLLTLVEREAAHRLAASGKPLTGLKPNCLPDYRAGSRADGNSRARKKWSISASRGAACASTTSTAALSGVASSTTPAASGRPVFAIASWKCAVRCITFG
jgi:hypothetical protein